jgi:hypothetical protein
MAVVAATADQWTKNLRDVSAVLLPILPFDCLHLVFKTKFQLLEPNFFQFFIFAEVALLGERIKASRILHMFLSQLAKFIVIGQQSVIRSQHPVDLQPGFWVNAITAPKSVQCQILVQSRYEKTLKKIQAAKDRIVRGIRIVALAQSDFFETKLSVQSPRAWVRLADLQKYGTSVFCAGVGDELR